MVMCVVYVTCMVMCVVNPMGYKHGDVCGPHTQKSFYIFISTLVQYPFISVQMQ